MSHANVPPAPEKHASADDLLEFSAKLTGEDQESSAPNLGLLKLIVEIRKADTEKKDTWSPLINAELRHMKAAVRLLSEQPMIALRFGHSLEGAMKLVGILKSRASEVEMEKQLEDVINEELVPHMPSKSVEASKAFVKRATASSSRAKSRRDAEE